MANHSFVTTKKWLKADRVEQDLKEILLKRFGNKLPYTREGDYFTVGFEYPFSVPFWVENVHKLEWRNGGSDWCWWVQCILHNEFALLYNGTISDEGVGEKWKGVVNKYPTYASYINARMKDMPGRVQLIHKGIQKMVKSGYPKEVKATLNGLGK